MASKQKQVKVTKELVPPFQKTYEQKDCPIIDVDEYKPKENFPEPMFVYWYIIPRRSGCACEQGPRELDCRP